MLIFTTWKLIRQLVTRNRETITTIVYL